MARRISVIGASALLASAVAFTAVAPSAARAADDATLVAPCFRADTDPAAYVAAFEAEGWERFPPGAEADQAMLALVVSAMALRTMQMPDSPESLEATLRVAERDLGERFAGAVLLRRDGLAAVVSLQVDPLLYEGTFVRCLVGGDAIAEVDEKVAGQTPKPMIYGFVATIEQGVLAGNDRSYQVWLRATDLPADSGLFVDTVSYDVILPPAK